MAKALPAPSLLFALKLPLIQNKFHFVHSQTSGVGDLLWGLAFFVTVQDKFTQKLGGAQDAFGLFEKPTQLGGAFFEALIEHAQFGLALGKGGDELAFEFGIFLQAVEQLFLIGLQEGHQSFGAAQSQKEEDHSPKQG